MNGQNSDALELMVVIGMVCTISFFGGFFMGRLFERVKKNKERDSLLLKLALDRHLDLPKKRPKFIGQDE